MLSAVETSNHLGTGRPYNVHHHHHHMSFGGSGVGVPSPSITAGTGINSYPTNVVPPMSAAEFVKPHPKLSRYSLPLRNGNSTAALPPSPGNGSSGKFKYATAPVSSEQPVNLAIGSPSAASSPNSSPQSMPHSAGIDKMTFDFMYNRHAAAAAAAAAAGIFPQSYPMLYPSGLPPSPYATPGSHPPPSSSPQSMKGNVKLSDVGSSSTMSPPVTPAERYPMQPQFHGNHLQKSGKGSTTGVPGGAGGFLLPPAVPGMMTQADLEALQAYHERLYYNGHGQSPADHHLLNAQRLQQSSNMPQQQQPPPRSHPVPTPTHSAGKRAIVEPGQGYHPQSQGQRPGMSSGHLKAQDKNNNVGFKVPSGKEAASMKPRQMATKGKGRTREAKGTGVVQNGSSYGSSNIVKSNFNRGVLIELGNGELKPVEEMRTEDFILSSNVTPDLELIDSTVLRIVPQGSVVMLTLSNSASKLSIDLTVAPEHPFFVYRQGWASCHPEGTYQLHGLKCQRLEVGDVCISLMQKERVPSHNPEAVPVEDQSRAVHSSGSSGSSSLSSPPLPSSAQDEPQNLSRRPAQAKESRGLIEGTTHHPSLNQSPAAEISQPLHNLVHAHLNHAPPAHPTLPLDHVQQHHQQHSSGSATNNGGGGLFGSGGPAVNGNPLMNSFLSTFKHLAAIEAAKAAMGGSGNGGGSNGLSHSIKNLVKDSHGEEPGLSSAGSSKRRYSAPDNVFADAEEPLQKRVAGH